MAKLENTFSWGKATELGSAQFKSGERVSDVDYLGLSNEGKIDTLTYAVMEPEYGIKDKVDVLRMEMANIGVSGYNKLSYGGTIPNSTEVVQLILMTVHANNIPNLCIYSQRAVYFNTGTTPISMVNLQVKLKYNAISNNYDFYVDMPAGGGFTSYYSFWGLRQ